MQLIEDSKRHSKGIAMKKKIIQVFILDIFVWVFLAFSRVT